MKKTKVIIPALGLLLLSTAASVTGTVAWFSANSTVTATSMTINARTDSNFLIIVEGSVFNSSASTTHITSNHEAVSLSPVAPVSDLTVATVAAPGSWHYTYSDDPNNYAQGAEQAFINCTAENFSNYVASETFSIGLTASSAQTQTDKNLVLKSVTLPDQKGINCVVVCGNVLGNFTTTGTATTLPLDLAVKATKSGTVVTIYYYLNGEDANVFSNNIYTDASQTALKLTGAINFEFGLAA